MLNTLLYLGGLVLLPSASAGSDQAHHRNAQKETSVDAVLVNLNGARVGKVRLHEAPKGVLMVLQAKGLAPGWHGMHFHQTGDCSAGFQNAGGHILSAAERNRGTGHSHDHAHSSGASHLVGGLLNEGSNDAGALPNIFVTDDGLAAAEIFTSFVSLWGRDGRPALLDADGASLIIHEGPEDQTGASDTVGKRVACAVIRTQVEARPK